MTNLNPSMRLKVKRDTFFLPESNNSVYFRNNTSSFRMEGSTIDQWVEKLLPMFNGEYTLENMTKGLSGPYRDRVYDIAGVLYQNGFARDVSQDRPHQLADQVLKKYASQIEFVDSFVDSGAYRFQSYRQTQVLAIGSGPFLISLVSSLIESGLPKFHVLITDTVPTNRQRVIEIEEHARKTDPEVAVEEISLGKEDVGSWREIVQPFESILYVSQVGDVEELRLLHTICREERKAFLPAICLQQVGLVGPLVQPDSGVSWESSWRRLHQSVFSDENLVPSFSSTAGAMLSNVIVFELFKEVAGVSGQEEKNQFYLLDLDTLEGNWHSFLPHPLVTGSTSVEWVEDLDVRFERDLSKGEPSKMLLYFNLLTSKEAGIFHIWEEGDLTQLPLAQCRVQAVDPLSDGPAVLLPDIICNGLTHEEARRESGLAGIEAYAAQMVELLIPALPLHKNGELNLQEFVGVGFGETSAEGVGRGLQKCLTEELRKQHLHKKNPVTRVQLTAVEDERCQFYLQSLTTIQGAPNIGLGEEVSGFPVVWIGTRAGWFGSVDLNLTMAMRNALQQALFKAQNQNDSITEQALEVSIEGTIPQSLVIPACVERIESKTMKSAVEVLERNRKQLMVFELGLEPFLKNEFSGVFGVVLREEDSW